MHPVGAVLKKLALGVSLIAISAGILLYSDLKSRNPRSNSAHKDHVRVALVQQTSIPPLDDGIAGALDALRERGYAEGGRMTLVRYNAQGDVSTANSIAKEVTSGDFDLIFSASTVSLQTIANANRNATPPRHHVFAIVTDPYAVGVGVSAQDHSKHPPYMTGVGSLPPVEDLFRLALKMNPSLKRVGLVWDAGEANSRVTTTLGRQVCAKLGLTLVESNAENATEVGQGVDALQARGIDAIWVSPDLTTAKGIDVIVRKAREARVPVFTSTPGAKTTGSLFDLGADYKAIGHVGGELAADVLDGQDPAKIPVENRMPKVLHINKTVLGGLKDRWVIPEDDAQNATVVVDDSGRHVKDTVAGGVGSLAKPGSDVKTADVTGSGVKGAGQK
jgi:putative ABC transport system substrate-binding protein